MSQKKFLDKIGLQNFLNRIKALIPTKTSELQNDSGFITSEGTYDSALSLESEKAVQNKVVTAAINGKQDSLSTAQTNAVDSGITSAKVQGYDSHISDTDIHVTQADKTSWDSKAPGTHTHLASEVSGLSTVATSGSYNDLSNKPSIPSKTSDLTNDSGFLTSHNPVDSALSSTSTNAVQNKVINTELGKKANSADLAVVATSGSYNDLSNKPTIPTVNNATLTIQKNGAAVNTFTANSSSNVTANITVPVNVSELTNDSGYLTSASSLDSSKLTGTIDIARLPKGALERLVTVADQTARFALTENDVQLGDTVKQLDTGVMYIVSDESKLSSADGYTEYTAGSATSVPWSGVQNKPSAFTPASHTHGSITNDGKLGTASRVLVTDSSKKIAVSSVTSTELGYLSGVTSAVQTQLNGKSDTGHTHTSSEVSGLATVATSGSYADLSNKPSIPSKTSDLTNDSGFLTSHNPIDSDLSSTSTNAVQNKAVKAALDGKADSAHTHTKSEITDFPTLSTVATSGSYNDLSNKPTIPTVYNKTLTIQQNGTTVKTFTANSNADVTANIVVPTKTSDLTNDSGYLTTHQSLADYSTKADTIKDLSISGKVITYTKGDDTTGTLTTQDTVYTHPTSAGNKHIPSGGSANQYLKYSASGTAQWATIKTSELNNDSGFLTSHNPVDSALSSTSENAVQNKVVKAELDNKANSADLSTVATTGSYTDLNNIPSNFTPASHTHGSITNDGKLGTASRALITDGNKKIAVSSVTSTELGYLSGVTSAVQDQLDGKAASTHSHIASEVSGLATVATSGSYNDLTNKPTIPTVNNATLTIQKNGTTVKTFTANASSNVTANITVPTKVSELTNDSGFLTSHNPVDSALSDTSTNAVQNKVVKAELDGKSDTGHTHTKSEITDFPTLATVATSGSYNDLSNKPTIPTVNNATLTIQKNGTTVKTFTANASSNVTANITVPTKVSELTNDSGFLTSASNLDSSKLTGTIDIARLPKGALERLVTVADQTARFALTTSDVQLGDTVKQLDTGVMYIVTDESKLSSADGYTEYTAGAATSVPWSGVTGKPSSYTPASHSHGNIANGGTLGTASRALITDGNKKITTSSVTSTELGYVSGVTSAIQTQLNGKAPSSHTHAASEVSGLATVATSGSYNDLSNKPTIDSALSSTSTNAVQNKVINTALAGKAASSHTHTKSQITDFPTKTSQFTNDSHQTITVGTDTTSTASPAHSGTFTCIDSVTRDSNGHVTAVNTKTVTLPADNNTDTLVTQNVSTANENHPVLLTVTKDATANQGAKTSIFASGVKVNPSTNTVTATTFSGALSGNASTATQFSANKSVTLTGDVTGTASSKAGWSVATTLSDSGVTAGTYGPSADVTGNNNATISVPEITVDAKGRVTSVVNRTLTCKNNTYSVYNKTLTIQKNGTNVATFTSNSSTDVTANITVPTKTSELTNDSGYLTSHQSLSNYVTLNSAQTITGNKNFEGQLKIDAYSWVIRYKTQGTSNYTNYDTFKQIEYNKFNNIITLRRSADVLNSGDNFNVVDTSFAFYKIHVRNKYVDLVDNTRFINDGTTNAAYPITTNATSLGTSTNKWANVYATTFTGNLTGNVTGNVSGTSANVTGTVAIANGGTGATSRLDAVKNLTSENVGTETNYFLTITTNWGKAGYCSVAHAKTVLGLGSAAYTASTAYAAASHTHTKSQITDFPTKVSAFTNDAGYLTSHQSLSNYVTLNGTQTISGIKTLSSNLLFSSTNTRGTAPSAKEERDFAEFKDSAGNKFSLFGTSYYTDKTSKTSILAYNTTVATGSSIGAISIGCDTSGNVYTEAPTPATADNSTKIATTAYVKSQGYLTSHQSLSNYSTLANTIKSLSISGKTITYTKGDNTTGTLTTQDTNTDTLMTQNVSTANATYPVLLTATADATANLGAKAGIFGSGVKVNPSTSIISCRGISGTPTAYNSYVNAVKDGGSLVSSLATYFGGVWSAPTKNYRVAAATFPNTGDTVYICYSVTNANVEAGTNKVAKQLTWDADSGTLTANSFSGALTGNVTGDCSGSSGSCTGNAATATQFSANKSVTLTGDVTGTASSKAGWSVATTLANSGVTAGSYGPSAAVSPTHGGTFSVPYITVDAKGRVTAASSKTITLPEDSNTDTKVTQTVTTGNSYYPVILGHTANQTETETSGARFSKGFLVNARYSFLYIRNTYNSENTKGVRGTSTYTNALQIFQCYDGTEMGRLYCESNKDGYTRVSLRATNYIKDGAIATDGTATHNGLSLDVTDDGSKLITIDGNWNSNLTPATNNSKTLGTSSLKWKAAYAVNFYENGTALTDKYVQINQFTNNGTSLSAGVGTIIYGAAEGTQIAVGASYTVSATNLYVVSFTLLRSTSTGYEQDISLSGTPMSKGTWTFLGNHLGAQIANTYLLGYWKRTA